MNNDWLDIAVLEDYLDGKLDAKTMNRVEREALEDPFVAEALAGLSMSPKRSLESLSLLQKQLHERVAEHHSAKKATVITWQRLSIAAAAAVIFISVGIIFWMKQVNYQEMASKRPKKIDVNIAPKVSSDSVIENADAVATLKTESTDKVPAEIDKAIKAAKTNSYAANSKPKSKSIANSTKPTPVAEATVAAAPVSAARVSNDSSVKLNEVVVVGYGVQRKQSVAGSVTTIRSQEIKDTLPGNGQVLQGKVAGLNIETASPADGWIAFREYLIKENRYSQELRKGEFVELEFNIKRSKPRNIKIIKGIEEKYNKEAIRLLKDGPKWNQPVSGSSKISITIEF